MPNESKQERLARSLKLLQELQALPEDERTARLDQLRADDADMGTEVASLLAASAPAGEFLERGGPGEHLRRRVEPEFGHGSKPGVAPLNIGPYRLLRVLGEGGLPLVQIAA